MSKQLLRPERVRQIPAQFSWVDQALVQQRLIDRCDARSAALYLFLVTVADSQGLSYYGAATLARRLQLSEEQLGAARERLIGLELVAYRAPLYQVLALPGTVPSPSPRSARCAPAGGRDAAGEGRPVSLAELLQQARARRG